MYVDDFPTTTAATPTGAEPAFPNFAQAIADRFDEPMPTYGEEGETAATAYETETDPDTGLTYARRADATATAETGAETGTETTGEAALPEVPAGYKLLTESEYAEMEAARQRSTQYSEFLQRFDSLGGPEQVQRLLMEQEQAALENAALAEQGRVEGGLQQMVEDGRMDAEVAETLAAYFGPMAAELARMRPVIENWKNETASTRAEREINSVLEKYPTAYAKSVRQAYKEGGLVAAEAEAKEYSAHMANVTKAQTQREAIATATTKPSTAPTIVNVRGQSATPPGNVIPKPGTKAFQQYWDGIMGKDE